MIRALLLTLLLAGCGTTPPPRPSVTSDDGQIRLTCADAGTSGGGLAVGGEGRGAFAILTMIGKIAKGIRATLKAGECEASIGGTRAEEK